MGYKRRVLYLASGRSVGGKDPGRKIAAIMNCWRQQGNEVKAIFGGDFEGGVGEPDGLENFGHTNYHNKWYRKFRAMSPIIHSASERRDITHNRIMISSLQEIVAIFKPDLIWERSYRLHSPGLEVAKALDIPHVLEWKDHLIDYMWSIYRRKALALEARKNQETNYIVVESEVLRSELVNQNVDVGKILVAHNAVDLDDFLDETPANIRLVRHNLGIGVDTVLVGYLGSYAFYHDTERLIRAAEILRSEGCEGEVQILMVGGGKEYEHSRRLAEERGLLDSMVTMIPGVPKDQVPEILAALDIAVLPGSTDIICPIKVQEYMACGLTAVVPDYKCNREVIEDGHTGVLFKPHDEHALAAKIRNLVEDRNLRERIGRHAREEVQRRFSWEATWGAALDTVINDIG